MLEGRQLLWLTVCSPTRKIHSKKDPLKSERICSHWAGLFFRNAIEQWQLSPFTVYEYPLIRLEAT